MAEEEKEAQSAKLQELIRRGTPEDLREANRLMKVMAGYDTRSKTDYRAKAAEEVGKIQAKARLLEERLDAFKPGDTMEEGDVFEELAAALSSAQPKIQKMCEEESEDHEAVAKLLEINDSIHRTVERWKLLKKGDIEGAANIAKGAPVPSLQGSAKAGGSSSAANELSLIDFDADSSASNGTSNNAGSSSQAGGLENDLLGLSMSDSGSFGQAGGISLGFGANTSKYLLIHPGGELSTDKSRCSWSFVVGNTELDGNRCPNHDHFSTTTILYPFCSLQFSAFSFPIQYPSAIHHVCLCTPQGFNACQ